MNRKSSHFRSSIARDRAGAAAIEFALLLPLLFALLSGSVELQEAFTVHRKLGQIAAVVADLVARENTLSSDDMADIIAGAETILGPYDIGDLNIVVVDTNTTDTTDLVAWSVASSGKAQPLGEQTAIFIPQDIREVGIQTITVQVHYSLNTMFSKLFNAYKMEATQFARPRNGGSTVLQ